MENSKRWQLVQAALNGERLEELVEKSAQFLNSPLVIISNTSNIVAYSKTVTVPDDTWQKAVKRGYITLEFSATLNNWDQLRDKGVKYECMTVSQINSHRRRFYKLVVHSQLLGYLNVTEANEAFDATSEEDYHFVVQLIAKELYAQMKFTDPVHKTLKEDILLDLINDKFINRGHLIECIHASNFIPDTFYRVLCADLTGFLSYNAGNDNFKLELLSLFPEGTIVITQQMLIILIEAKSCNPTEKQQLAALDTYLKQKKLVCGISDAFNDLFMFKRYRKQAIDAIHHKRYLLENNRNYIFYDEVKVYDILSQIPRHELMFYCCRQVYDIYQYDKTQKSDYLNTLMIYLLTNRSVKATANCMHLHRNTINYRIARIRELFQIDLDSISDQILLSCQLIKLLEDDQI